MTIQLPPLSSSRTGPPQKLVRQAREGAHYPETATYDPRKEDTVRSVTSDQLVRRLPTAAYPQKSGSNLSQGPVIYRPHPHQKHTGLLEFRAPSHPLERRGRSGREATAWAGVHRSALGQREATVQARNRTGHHARGGEPCRLLQRVLGGEERPQPSCVQHLRPECPVSEDKGRLDGQREGNRCSKPPKGCSGASSNEEVLSASAPAPTPRPSARTGLWVYEEDKGRRCPESTRQQRTHRVATRVRPQPGFIEP